MKFFRADDDEAGADSGGLDFVLTRAEPEPISIVTLALELDELPDALAHRLGDEVFIEELTGLRCVTVGTCRRLTDARHALREEMARRGDDAAARYEPPPPRRPDPYLAELAGRSFESGAR